LAVAHASSLTKAGKIIVSGFASLSTLDEGYYGKGMYFSSSTIYTLPYCLPYPDPCILICYLMTGNPYPVIEHPRKEPNFLGKHIVSGYQSHYVVTKGNGLPFEDEDFNLRKFNEIVVDQESQVVPIFLVELDNRNFKEVAENFQKMNEKSMRDNKNSAEDRYIDIDSLQNNPSSENLSSTSNTGRVNPITQEHLHEPESDYRQTTTNSPGKLYPIVPPQQPESDHHSSVNPIEPPEHELKKPNGEKRENNNPIFDRSVSTPYVLFEQDK